MIRKPPIEEMNRLKLSYANPIEEAERLEACLADTKWYAKWDNLLFAADLLETYAYISTAREAIYFFEKPWKYENELKMLASQLKEVI